MDYPVEYLNEVREHKDDEFKNSPYSPLTPEQRKKFNGLSYFEPNPALEFELTPIEFEDKDVLRVLTSTNEIRHYQRWGQVQMTVEDQPVTLTLFLGQGDTQFFLPFADTTNGTETYGAGRYVELEETEPGKYRIDFNEAYNPYCAYGDQWSCPLIPAENRLAVPIRAGEKKPIGDWLPTGHA